MMNIAKSLSTLLLICLVLTLGGCKDVKEDDTKDEEYADWFLNPPIAEDAIFSVGISQNKNPQIALERATNHARTEIARMVKIKVSTMTKDFLEEAGVPEETASIEFTSFVSKQIANNTISGSGIAATHVDKSTDPDTFYVLMRLNLTVMTDIIDGTLVKSEAAYAKLQAKKGLDELSNELKQMKGTD